MNSNALEVLTRHAGVLSRRGSLRVLGGAALASALVSYARTVAGKAHKNTNKHKKAKNPCTKQQAQCAAAVTAYCGQFVDPALCESIYLPCCEHFTDCNVETGITCLYAPSSTG